MKRLATNSRNALESVGELSASDEAIKSAAGALGSATGSKFEDVALRSAPSKRGSRDMATRKPGALRTARNEGSYWETIPAYASSGRHILTPFERSELLMAECGIMDE